MARRLITDSPEMQARFDEASTAAGRHIRSPKGAQQSGVRAGRPLSLGMGGMPESRDKMPLGPETEFIRSGSTALPKMIGLRANGLVEMRSDIRRNDVSARGFYGGL